MKTMTWAAIAALLLGVMACSASRHTTGRNDTYFTAKEREKANKAQQAQRTSEGVDSRDDNFTRARREYDDDYCYSCRVRRYSTGVWYDPWCDPWWGPGWGARSWYGPGWGWGPNWGWNTGWGWGTAWGPAFAGPGWYYTPGWGWSYYAGPGGWMSDPGWSSPSTPRYNYAPRTYTAPRGGTTYTPPRSGVVTTPSGTPPRRSAAPAPSSPRPTYSPAPSSGGRSTMSPGGGRPSIQSGSTGGGIRSTSPAGGGGRPR